MRSLHQEYVLFVLHDRQGMEQSGTFILVILTFDISVFIHFITVFFCNKVIADIKASSKEPLNIATVNELIYATTVVITEAKGVKVKKRTQKTRRKPKWKENLEKDIQNKRSDLFILTDIQNKSEVKPRKQENKKKI